MRSKKALYNIISNLILQLVVIVYGFIVPKIIISKYGSNVNGLVSSITQFLGYIALLESGFGPVVKSILYKPIANNNKKEIANILKASEKFFKRIAKIFIVYIIGLSFLYPVLVGREFGYIYTVSLIIIISISTFAQYYFGMTYQLYLQAEQRNYVQSIIQIITYILSILAIIIIAMMGASIQVLKLVSGLIFILRPILQNIYVKKKYKINFNEVDESYNIKNKWDGLSQHIAAVVHGNTDIAILTIFSKLSEISVYSVYYLVVSGIKQIIQIFSLGIDAIFGDMIAKDEKENLNKKFNMYEIVYFTIVTILFTSTIILVTPFIKIYTLNIMDANYIRYKFGYLIVISEYIWAIRLPYSSISIAAGRFKETMIGAWVESISNIIISIILVFKYGIIGVAIGTIVAMTLRTIEFLYQTNKFILNRKIIISVKKIIIVIIDTLLILIISRYLPFVDNINYFNWIKNAIMTVSISCCVTITINYILYKKEFINLYKILKNLLKHKIIINREK